MLIIHVLILGSNYKKLCCDMDSRDLEGKKKEAGEEGLEE